MNHSRHQYYKNKQSNNKYKKQNLKVKNSPLELERYFKPVIVSTDDVDKFEEKKSKRSEQLQKKLDTIGIIGQSTLFLIP